MQERSYKYEVELSEDQHFVLQQLMVVLQKLPGEHEVHEASLPVQLRLPLQTGWR